MSVTLFKSEGGNLSAGSCGDSEDDDKFLGALRQAKFTVNLIPVLSFEFFNLEDLWREVKFEKAHEGLILTSPRCVESLERAIQTYDDHSDWERELKKCWLNKVIYCVGPSTVTHTLEFFKLAAGDEQSSNIFMSDKGNSESLAKIILAESAKTPIKLPLLYPCGNLKTDKLSSLLDEGNVPYKTVTVYKTVKNPALERNADCLQDMAICVFFSPSGVNFAMPHLADVENKKFIALGPTTKEALEKVEIPNANIYQCPMPTPDGLIQVLESLQIPRQTLPL